jgi:hypothetical protein
MQKGWSGLVEHYCAGYLPPQIQPYLALPFLAIKLHPSFEIDSSPR